ncbi:MAG: hypothetical protein WC635_07660 [Bacteriovorax sp.]|jgi:hypothetical protein
MKTILFVIIGSLFITGQSWASGTGFTPDHLEGSFRGSSRSDIEPEYCMLDAQRETMGQQITFNIEISHKGALLSSFPMTSEYIRANLRDHSTYLEFKNERETLQVNIAGKEILNFTYLKFDGEKRVQKILTCSNR